MITPQAIFSALIAGLITAAALSLGGCLPDHASSERAAIKQHLVKLIAINPDDEYEKGLAQ